MLKLLIPFFLCWATPTIAQPNGNYNIIKVVDLLNNSVKSVDARVMIITTTPMKVFAIKASKVCMEATLEYVDMVPEVDGKGYEFIYDMFFKNGETGRLKVVFTRFSKTPVMVVVEYKMGIMLIFIEKTERICA